LHYAHLTRFLIDKENSASRQVPTGPDLATADRDIWILELQIRRS
jgi:hypothetical protein